MSAVKTRKLTDAEVTSRLHDGCPACGSKLTSRARMKEDDKGNRRFAGSFFGCSAFGRGCTANYYLSVDTNVEKIIEEV